MIKAVVRGYANTLIDGKDLILYSDRYLSEKSVAPHEDYIKKIWDNIRSYDEVVRYIPNQVFIGGANEQALRGSYEENSAGIAGTNRKGKFGQILSLDELIAAIYITDAFDHVWVTEDFTEKIKPKLRDSKLFDDRQIDEIKGTAIGEVRSAITSTGALPIFIDSQLIGCIKNAQEDDENLSSKVMLSNLVSKASSILAVKQLLLNTGINPLCVDYIIDASGEAAGDRVRRGGGGFAKSIAEMTGLENAYGVDMRSFNSGGGHAIIHAAALVQSGVFENVVVVSGGSSSLLASNFKEHVSVGMDIVEDVIASYALLISKNDQISPIINTKYIGKHSISTGSTLQSLISALVEKPLRIAGISVANVDKIAIELQNPDITKAMGAGDVPLSNYKTMAYLARKSGQIASDEEDDFIERIGIKGFAPNQGQTSTGLSYIGIAHDKLIKGDYNRVLIATKGNLYHGRLTSLFDGISFMLEENDGTADMDEKETFDDNKARNIIADAMRGIAKEIRKKGMENE